MRRMVLGFDPGAVVALNAIANRIDRGYTVEVRAGELSPPVDEGEDTETDEEKRIRSIVEDVLARQEKLNFANDTGETILSLPEPKDETNARTGATGQTAQ